MAEKRSAQKASKTTKEKAKPKTQAKPKAKPKAKALRTGAKQPKKASGQKISNEARNWAMACHLSAFCGLIVPFGSILGPLVLWLIKRDQFPFVNTQGKEAVNFQITWTIYYFIAILLVLVVVGIFLIFLLMLLQVIFIIIASINAQNGEKYRYPLTIRFLT